MHGPSVGTMKCASSPRGDLQTFSLSPPPPLLGGTVILEVKVLLIANLLPADRSTETSEARRIQRWWSVVICPLTDDTTALNIRAIS